MRIPPPDPDAPQAQEGPAKASPAGGSRRGVKPEWRHAAAWIALIAVAIASGVWLFRLTEKGIGIGSDSAVYFAGAENLNQGKGFVWRGGDQLPRPINHYPPFYSDLLALAFRVEADPATAARAIAVIVMAVNTLLVGGVVGLLASSVAAGVVGALVFALSAEMLSVHSWAMSDGLYLTLVLTCLWLSIRQAQGSGGRTNRALMWASAALGWMTRYVGLALFLVPILATLLRPPRSSRRWREAAIGTGLAMLPGLIWLGRNLIRTDSMTNRVLGFFPPSWRWWEEIGTILASWFVPGRIQHALEAARISPAWITVPGLAALIVVGIVLSRTDTPPGYAKPGWILLLALILGHLGAVALSSWLTYPGPDLNTRNLAPVYLGWVIAIAAALGFAWSRGSRSVRATAVILALALVGYKAYASRTTVALLLEDGQGYSSRSWSKSQVVASLVKLSPGVIYTDDTGAAYYFTGRYAFTIPLQYDSVSGVERTDFGSELCRMRSRLRAENGALVLFGAPTLRESADPEEVTAGLQPIVGGPSRGIYVDPGGLPIECPDPGESSGPLPAVPEAAAKGIGTSDGLARRGAARVIWRPGDRTDTFGGRDPC